MKQLLWLIGFVPLLGCGTTESFEEVEPFVALAECAEPVCDAPASVSMSDYRVEEVAALECVAIGFRDRVPGRYEIGIKHEWGDGVDNYRVIYRIEESGSVEAVFRMESLSFDGEEWTEFTSDSTALRCTLAQPNTIQACLDAISASNEGQLSQAGMDCLDIKFGLTSPEDGPAWLLGCEEVDTVCQ